MLWKDSVEVEVLVNHLQFAHLKIKFPDSNEWVFFTAVYCSPRGKDRRRLWAELKMIASDVSAP